MLAPPFLGVGPFWRSPTLFPPKNASLHQLCKPGVFSSPNVVRQILPSGSFFSLGMFSSFSPDLEGSSFLPILSIRTLPFEVPSPQVGTPHNHCQENLSTTLVPPPVLRPPPSTPLRGSPLPPPSAATSSPIFHRASQPFFRIPLQDPPSRQPLAPFPAIFLTPSYSSLS